MQLEKRLIINQSLRLDGNQRYENAGCTSRRPWNLVGKVDRQEDGWCRVNVEVNVEAGATVDEHEHLLVVGVADKTIAANAALV